MFIYSVLKCIFENNGKLPVVNKKKSLLSSLHFAACVRFPSLQWTFQMVLYLGHELAEKVV